MTDKPYPIEKMTEQDVEAAVDLITRAMNPTEATWARKTMDGVRYNREYAVPDSIHRQ